MTTKARELPTYDGVTTVDEFLEKFESTVPEQQQYGAIEWVLCATPVRWWSTHQETIIN